MTTAFRYEGSPDPIRDDLAEAHREAWAHIANPGTWLSGAQRVAVAAETRRARSCSLCRTRKAALSPASIDGKHDDAGSLSESMVDVIHRVTTDAPRLTHGWYRSLLEQGLTAEEYVEAIGVSVIAISVDQFHHALGIPPEALPMPVHGEPTRICPTGIVEGEAWVPMLDSKRARAEAGLGPGPAPMVIRALTLVPEEVRAWRIVSAAQYLGDDEMLSFETDRGIDRPQIELVAGRVSALNECFY